MSKPLQTQLRRHSTSLLMILVFSTFTNLLMLTSPLFMLQVYDRVLNSRSEPTLVVLFVLITFLFAAYGVLDFIRGWLAANIGVAIQKVLDPDVFRAAVATPRGDALNDIQTVKRFFSTPLVLAGFDLLWTPLFWGLLYLFHPWLGGLALLGGMILFGVALINQTVSQRSAKSAAAATVQSAGMAEQFKNTKDTISALGMQDAVQRRWLDSRSKAMIAEHVFSNRTGGFGSLTRTIRFYLQSAMLALGAYLVLHNDLSAGAMVASSIMLGRMLSPVEQLISGWGQVVRVCHSWSALNALMATHPAPPPQTPLPRPAPQLDVNAASVALSREHWILRHVDFSLAPGQALGVIGESGAGKSALARVLSGTLDCTQGEVRLGGATLGQYGDQGLGRLIGYLPQTVTLYDGTIAENIARLDKTADPQDIIRAAQTAGAHEMILSLPSGYDTALSGPSPQLSGGQIQRIGLARAVFGNPVLLILDEPTAHLDAKGSAALNTAVHDLKANGCAIVIMTHRPAAIVECDQVLYLDKGHVRAFGPREETLRQVIQNPTPSTTPLQAVK